MKPLLLLDVDGVILPFWSQKVVPISLRLKELQTDFDLVWATFWENKANSAICPELDLPTLPVIEFFPKRYERDVTLKLDDVISYVEDRPLAWIDDDLYSDAREWAEAREAPTLLLRPFSEAGMQDAHFEILKDFAISF